MNRRVLRFIEFTLTFILFIMTFLVVEPDRIPAHIAPKLLGLSSYASPSVFLPRTAGSYDQLLNKSPISFLESQQSIT
jgi:hypothetical protein